jgi:hypothetical protein
VSIYTKLPNVPDSDADVRPGMASFLGSGPAGATCESCIHRGYYRAGKSKFDEQTGLIEETRKRTMGCKEFLRLNHRHGPAVDRSWAACKYYIATQPPPKPVKASDYDCTSVSGVDLRDTVVAIRARRRFNDRSEGFLDSLLIDAGRHEVVFISFRRWRWLADLARRAGLGAKTAGDKP